MDEPVEQATAAPGEIRNIGVSNDRAKIWQVVSVLAVINFDDEDWADLARIATRHTSR